MNKDIEKLFKRVANEKGWNIELIPSDDGKGYKEEAIIVDFNRYYGGYKLVKVNKNTSEVDLTQRMSKKEFEAFLKGILFKI